MAKIFCYTILLVAFLLFFQKDPLFALIILAITIGIFVFFRKRKTNRSGGTYSFLSGKGFGQSSQLNNVVMLLALEKLLSNSKETDFVRKQKSEDRKERIDRIKQEVIELLERE